jgi:hypothetical protein
VVEREDVSLRLRVRSVGRSYKQAIARVSDADSRRPIQNEWVKFEVRNNVIKSRTNSDGVAKIRVHKPARRISALFEHDYYNTEFRQRP